ncbi:peptidylprolyl isomerase [uncultured Propionivibrio sp.]|uniref:peptidylprolyl isomerase n=1 Tax=uncultured Propionivibrio sp. TaxID=426737 RepID=UPI0037484637
MHRMIRFLSAACGLIAAVAVAAPSVEMQTSAGRIVLELDAAKAPKTVDNFLQYVRSGHYDGTVFHRVIDGFMIQGGGFSKDMGEKQTRAPIQNEAANGLRNQRGTIAMARTGDPHSATAQFFINLNDNAFLNHTAPSGNGWGYAVFGKVTQGMEVVDRIAKVATGNRGFHQNVPIEPVTIQTVKVLSDK